MATKKRKPPTKVVTVSVYVKWARCSDPVPATAIPKDLATALSGLASGKVTEAAACKVASKYVTANFLGENLDGSDELFRNAEEVWATEIEVNKLQVVPGQPLPRVTAAASFALQSKPGFPEDDEAMEEWNDEHGYFTDAVNFFWRFGTTDLVLGDYEEAGGGVDEYP